MNNIRKDKEWMGNIFFLSFISIITYLTLYKFNIDLFFIKILSGYYLLFLSLGLLWGYIYFQKRHDLEFIELIGIAFPLNLIIIITTYIILRLFNMQNFLVEVIFIMHLITFIITLNKNIKLRLKIDYKKIIIISLFVSYLLILFLFMNPILPLDNHTVNDMEVANNIAEDPFRIRYNEFPENKQFIVQPSSLLYYFFLAYSIILFGLDLNSFLSLNILFWGLIPIFIYSFAKNLSDNKRGVIAILLFALSFFSFSLFQVNNPQPIIGFFFLAFIYFLFKYIKDGKILNFNLAVIYSTIAALFQELLIILFPLMLTVLIFIFFRKMPIKKEFKSIIIYLLLPISFFLLIGFIFGRYEFLFNIFHINLSYTDSPKTFLFFLINNWHSVSLNFLKTITFPFILLMLFQLFSLKDKWDKIIIISTLLGVILGAYLTLREDGPYTLFVLYYSFFLPIWIVNASKIPKKKILRYIFYFLIVLFIIINLTKVYNLYEYNLELSKERNIDVGIVFNKGNINYNSNLFIIPKSFIYCDYNKLECRGNIILRCNNQNDCMDFGKRIKYIKRIDSFIAQYYIFEKDVKKDLPNIKFEADLTEYDNKIIWDIKIPDVDGLLTIDPVCELILADDSYILKNKLVYFNESYFSPQNPKDNIQIITSNMCKEYAILDNIKSAQFKFLVIFNNSRLPGYGIFPIS